MSLEPKRSDYANYHQYVLAVVGYAVLSRQVCGGAVLDRCDHERRVAASDATSSGVDAWSGAGSGVVGEPGLRLCNGEHGGVDAIGGEGVRSTNVADDGAGLCVTVSSSEAVDSPRDARVGGGGLSRGKNFLRNQKSRERRKKRRVQAGSVSSREEVSSSERGAVIGGFWRSCSDDVRQRLIDSKARMHIAENERRVAEANDKIGFLNSPQAIMGRAVKFIGQAEEYAKKANDNKVYRWAQAVAAASAESLAKTAADSVPSFETYNERLPLTEELKVKQVEIDGLRAKIRQLESRDGKTNRFGVPSATVDRSVELEIQAVKDKYDAMDSYYPEDMNQEIAKIRKRARLMRGNQVAGGRFCA